VRALVTIGGYNVQNTVRRAPPGPPDEGRRLWYQWYFNTERGRAGLAANRRELCRLLWQEWSPTWRFDDAVYDATAASFDNPDFVDVVIHSYRHRHGNAPGDPRFADVERRLAERPSITVPSVILHGADDAVDHAHRTAAHLERFVPGTERHVVAGAGHFLPREKPAAVAKAMLGLLARTG